MSETNTFPETQPWLLSILADPVTKQPCQADAFPRTQGAMDARVFLKNTYGFDKWLSGQEEYEDWADNVRKTTTVAEELEGIKGVRPVYEYFPMAGRILDVGGGAGRVREFLPDDAEFVSTDPWSLAQAYFSDAEKAAYRCLKKPCNFNVANAEFQPFIAESFDWVHMRSMLDHVQIPDLAIREAQRVLRQGGFLLVGLYVEGGKSGVISLERRTKDLIKSALSLAGIDRWKDHHTWHPTYRNLIKLITDNGFEILDTFWQPSWHDTVCYVKAVKTE
jgi:SAM-dependent methyltransferase